MKKQTLIGGIAGGVASFFLGWLVYGILLMDYYSANGNACANRNMDDMIWWAMIGSNLIWGYFLAIIFEWTNTNDFMEGLKKGAVLGLITTAGYDLGMHSMTTWYSSETLIIVDIIVSIFFTGVLGGFTAWVMGKVK